MKRAQQAELWLLYIKFEKLKRLFCGHSEPQNSLKMSFFWIKAQSIYGFTDPHLAPRAAESSSSPG